MELSRSVMRAPIRASAIYNGRATTLALSPMAVWSRRQFSLSTGNPMPGAPGSSFGGSPSGMPQAYFQRSQRLPSNTVIKFVPQQTAWIVERMGKFSRILSPGLAILIPVIEVRESFPYSVAECLRVDRESHTSKASKNLQSRSLVKVPSRPTM